MTLFLLSHLSYLLLLLFSGSQGNSDPGATGTRLPDRKMYHYLSYLPDNYAASQGKYPLIIYLHGSSARGTDLARVKISGLPRLAEDGLPLEFILIAPQCPSGKLWSADDWLSPLLEELHARYRIDRDKIYLTGVSMGGGGTFDVAKRQPEVFAALAPLCAWASTTDQLCRLKDIPVWTFHGGLDHVVPVSETEEKVQTLKKCNGNIRYTRLEGEGHGIHSVYDPSNEYKLLNWLLQHTRKQ